MKRFSGVVKAVALVALVLGALALGSGAVSAGKLTCVGANCAINSANQVSNGQVSDLTGTIQTIINVVIFVIGFVAVAMVILGGVQYSTSSGDSAKVKKAKDTIMYGIIGLVVSILAFAIVNFVLQGVFGA